MKVVCIDNSPGNYMPLAALLLKEGNIYTVSEFINDGEHSGYRLDEIKHPDPEGYWFYKRFISLSTIDETQMERKIDTIKQLK